jgi:hypothetical protein
MEKRVASALHATEQRFARGLPRHGPPLARGEPTWRRQRLAGGAPVGCGPLGEAGSSGPEPDGGAARLATARRPRVGGAPSAWAGATSSPRRRNSRTQRSAPDRSSKVDLVGDPASFSGRLAVGSPCDPRDPKQLRPRASDRVRSATSAWSSTSGCERAGWCVSNRSR